MASSLSAQIVFVSHARDFADVPADGPVIIVADPKPLLQDSTLPSGLSPLDLILAHDLHALDAPYELILTRLRLAAPKTRIVGSSASLSDPSALADWLSVPELSVYNFAPTARSSALVNSFQPFSAPHSGALLRLMVKPAYSAMRTASGSTICFVPSRTQCRFTAKELVTQSATDLDESFVDGSLEAVETYAQTLSDPDLAEALTHGIAVYHEGLQPQEQRIALELFSTGAVRVLVTSREACWTLPLNASLVIVMSAQYAARTDPDAPNHEREIRDYPLAELVQMQSLAFPPSSDASAELLVLCQPEQADLYKRFLEQGLPLESQLAQDSLLPEAVLSELANGKVNSRQDVTDWFSWTFAYQRLQDNPSYYRERTTVAELDRDDEVSRFVDELLDSLEARCCLLYNGKTDFAISEIGRLVCKRGVPLHVIDRLQQVRVEELVARAGPSVNGRSGGMTNGGNKTEEDAQDLDTLANFHQRLPRAVKDAIGMVEAGSDTYRSRVLLAAFAAGRVPRGKGGLEVEQAALVRKLLDSSSSA